MLSAIYLTGNSAHTATFKEGQVIENSSPMTEPHAATRPKIVKHSIETARLTGATLVDPGRSILTHEIGGRSPPMSRDRAIVDDAERVTDPIRTFEIESASDLDW